MSDREPHYHPLSFERRPVDEMRARATEFAELLGRRRTVRHFSSEPVPAEIIDDAIRAAATAPSGANQQPWTFAVISNAEMKQKIREAAEAEERESYESRMSPEWLAAIAHLGTDWHKPHLTDAPYVIVVFSHAYDLDETGARVKNYYVAESVGMAVGMLLAALHNAGLATLTHTPSPMRFLREILGRPENERAYVVIPVGYPADNAEVPVITKKPLDDILARYD